MKCDKLQQVENPIEWGLYYDKHEVDAAIAELKAELSDARDDARSSRNLVDDKNEEIKELEDKIQQKDFFWEGCGFSKMGFKNTIDVANYVDSLKAVNESLRKAVSNWHDKYCNLQETIDRLECKLKCVKANKDKELRATKRALWLARAERAEARKNYWYVRSIHEGDTNLWSIDGSAVKYIGCIKRTNYDWLLTWSEVESRCRAKAEEYK